MCIIIFDYMLDIMGKRAEQTELNNINHQIRACYFSVRFLLWEAESIYSNCAGPRLYCNFSQIQFPLDFRCFEDKVRIFSLSDLETLVSVKI